ncbi:hypothetical protein [Ancrocorticia populi]|uniref:hypothetical protein n=1 Tax=Ancrocorticia populi TaxID=2175228 RepID=UPI0014030230|nr:hypothetical protein [Ancrocorticia populi]
MADAVKDQISAGTLIELGYRLSILPLDSLGGIDQQHYRSFVFGDGGDAVRRASAGK